MKDQAMTIEETKEGQLIRMPTKSYIMLSEQYALDTHIRNLIRTFGIEAVVEHMVHILKAHEGLK